ncbi:MAG: CAP domain-containing protein [Rhodothermales bacterium]|nr:CAP domain-containing protein [Rhodothermales bacterium]
MRIVLVVAALGLAACGAPSASTRAQPASPSSPPALDLGRIARQIHDRTNSERVQNGLTPLAWSDSLARLAGTHSNDMARRRFFNHHDPEGRDVNGRGEALGMTCRYEIGNTIYRGFSENIIRIGTYRGWREESDGVTTTRTYDYRPESVFAPEIVTGWMNSPGHRANILQPTSRAEGLSLAASSDGNLYVTQVFC